MGFADWVCQLLDYCEINITHGNIFFPPTAVVKCNISGKLRKTKVDSECGVSDSNEVWFSLLVNLMRHGILKE